MERNVELAIVYFIAPLIVFLGWWPQRAKMLLLGAVTILQLFIAIYDGASRTELGIAGGDFQWCVMWGLAMWLALQTLAAIACQLLGRPTFPFAEAHPRLFLPLAVAYWFSVVAQEFMFRSYFFWRFASVGSLHWIILLNVLAFGWIHIVFKSWLAVGLTLIGGVLFAELFLATHSFWGICIVHWFVGLSIFAMGYGRHFYGGSRDVARHLSGQPELAV